MVDWLFDEKLKFYFHDNGTYPPNFQSTLNFENFL